MQLYSVEQKRSQALEAHAAAFSTIKVQICLCLSTFYGGPAVTYLSYGLIGPTDCHLHTI